MDEGITTQRTLKHSEICHYNNKNKNTVLQKPWELQRYQYRQGNINSFPFILNVLKFIQDIQFRNSDAWKNLHFVKTNIRDQ